MDFNWTDEAVATLKSRWAEGYSASSIGQYLGITRNAVMGKIHRLALPRKIPTEKLPKRATPPRKAKIKPWVPVRQEIKPPSGREISFMELGWAMCRYIPNEPKDINTMYCGDPTDGLYSYCPHHLKLCTQRLSSRALIGAVTRAPPSDA